MGTHTKATARVSKRGKSIVIESTRTSNINELIIENLNTRQNFFHSGTDILVCATEGRFYLLCRDFVVYLEHLPKYTTKGVKIRPNLDGSRL